MNLDDAARSAPRGAGIYCFLAADEELLYVGKAGDLGARLRAHARRPRGFVYDDVVEVRWEEHPDEAAAVRREADLIVALRPRLNASHVDDGKWAFVVVDASGLTLAAEPAGRAYGCFAHLGRGVSSAPAIACSDGYVALLRLLWAASTDTPIPARVTRSAPESFAVDIAPLASELLRFLAGTSPRLLRTITLEHRQRHELPALERDRVAAAAFFAHGPAALRGLRLAHGLPAGPVEAEVVRQLLADELRASIGEFRPPAPSGPRGRRTRQWVSPPVGSGEA